MIRWVTLHEFPESRKKEPKPVRVNPALVSVVYPHSGYTTLWLSGHYLHVTEDAETVERILSDA